MADKQRCELTYPGNSSRGAFSSESSGSRADGPPDQPPPYEDPSHHAQTAIPPSGEAQRQAYLPAVSDLDKIYEIFPKFRLDTYITLIGGNDGEPRLEVLADARGLSTIRDSQGKEEKHKSDYLWQKKLNGDSDPARRTVVSDLVEPYARGVVEKLSALLKSKIAPSKRWGSSNDDPMRGGCCSDHLETLANWLENAIRQEGRSTWGKGVTVGSAADYPG
jgi:hypothetical protein